jgi:hypothetical protein
MIKIDFGKIDYSTRIRVGAMALLTLTSLLTNLNYFRARVFEPLNIGRDEITLSEQRFGELRKVLPPRGVVGFVSDEMEVNGNQEPIDKTQRGWWLAPEVKKYYLTQYALAPLIVVRGTDKPLIVGNFSNGWNETITRAHGLTPLRDFGNGVVLFEKKTN